MRSVALVLSAAVGTRLGGFQLRLTGAGLSESICAIIGQAVAYLQRSYHSYIDERLNYEQSLEVVMLVVRKHWYLEGVRLQWTRTI